MTINSLSDLYLQLKSQQKSINTPKSKQMIQGLTLYKLDQAYLSKFTILIYIKTATNQSFKHDHEQYLK